MKKGFKHSEETKRKMSETHKKKLHNNVFGKHWKLSEKTKKKLSEVKTGAKHWRWQGGLGKNKEYRREYEQKWRNNNRSKWNYYNSVRKTKKLNADGSHTFAEWELLKAQYNWTCPSCKKREPEIKLTEDHIIPFCKGGSNNIENIQPLCRSCNSKKNVKTIKYDID